MRQTSSLKYYFEGFNIMRRRSTSRLFDRKPDRIEKAVALIHSNAVNPKSEGSFKVWSDGEGKHYEVTLISCECEDFHFNTDMCKHQWASWGAMAAQLILKIRRSTSFVELEGWASQFADFLLDTPENFLAVVRQEYRARIGVIYQATAKRRAS
jgi:hypothetical protein